MGEIDINLGIDTSKPCSGRPNCEGFPDNCCGECRWVNTRQERMKRIWQNMSEKEKRYDLKVDPLQYRVGWDGEPVNISCSCHINPPCSVCENSNNDDFDDDD